MPRASEAPGPRRARVTSRGPVPPGPATRVEVRRAVGVAVCLAGCLAGCPETKEDLLTQGNLAVWRKDADGAIALFDKVLAMDPADVDAHRGMANAYDEKGDDARAEEWMRNGGKLAGIRDADRRFFQQALEKLLLGRAQKAVAPADIEAAFRAAIELRADSRANGLLARHLMGRSEALAREGKVAEAADVVTPVLDLRVSTATKEAAMALEMGHRLSLFRAAFDPEFPARHEAALVAEGAYDAAARRFKVSVRAEVPAASPPAGAEPAEADPTNRASEAAAAVAHQTLLTRLSSLSGAALPSPAPSLSFQTWQADSEGWVRRPTTYQYAASVTYDEAVQAIFMIKENDRLAAARAKIDGPREAEAAAPPTPAEPAAPAAAKEGEAPAAPPPTAPPAP